MKVFNLLENEQLEHVQDLVRQIFFFSLYFDTTHGIHNKNLQKNKLDFSIYYQFPCQSNTFDYQLTWIFLFSVTHLLCIKVGCQIFAFENYPYKFQGLDFLKINI